MAPENYTSTINKEQQMALLPDEAETAATLLKIMAGAALSSIGGDCRASPFAQQSSGGTSLSFQPNTHQMAAAPEANQQHSFQGESSPSQPQVPNPLQHHKTLSTHMQTAAAAAPNRHRSSKGTTPKNENNNANKSSATMLAQPQTYNVPNANLNNFMIPSPTSTYSFLQSLIHQQQQQASLAAVAASMSNQYLQDVSSTTPNPLLLLAKNSLVPSSASYSSISTTKEQVDNDEQIRREEVVKALHSKPQRGRKRRNLNEEERQELTRTRNREHAKSTRERKKQRHLELLDMERLYQEVKRQQDMQDQRREVLCRFVAARQAMLQQVLDNENSSPKEGSSAAAALNVVDGLILSRGDLRHHIRGQRGGADLDGVTLMGLFDRSFAALLPAQGSQASYRYDANAIALTQQGDAKLECSICFGARAIKTMHMTVSFADGTAKIIAVDIAFLQDESSSASERQPPSLGNQVSHPSVVSLDDRYGYSFSRSKTEDEDSQMG